jgi:hypothetical protein
MANSKFDQEILKLFKWNNLGLSQIKKFNVGLKFYFLFFNI